MRSDQLPVRRAPSAAPTARRSPHPAARRSSPHRRRRRASKRAIPSASGPAPRTRRRLLRDDARDTRSGSRSRTAGAIDSAPRPARQHGQNEWGLATGRKAWLFVGSDDHGQAAGNLLTLVASSRLHHLDPEAYLRDLFRVLPHWPRDRYLELAPRYWCITRARLDADQLERELVHSPSRIRRPRRSSRPRVERIASVTHSRCHHAARRGRRGLRSAYVDHVSAILSILGDHELRAGLDRFVHDRALT